MQIEDLFYEASKLKAKDRNKLIMVLAVRNIETVSKKDIKQILKEEN